MFGGSSPKKTIGSIKTKSGTTDYVWEGNSHSKFGKCDYWRLFHTWVKCKPLAFSR